MADVFDDMMGTAGALPPDANDRQPPKPRVSPTPGMRTKEVPQNNASLAAEKSRSEAIFKLMGSSLQEEEEAQSLAQRQMIVQQVYKDAEKNAPFLEKLARGIDRMDNNIVTKAAKDTVGAAINVSAGIALGASNAFYSGVNAFKEGYNVLGKMAKEHGLINEFEPTQRIDFSAFQDKNYPETSKVIANIGQAISPAIVAAGVASGSGPVAGVVAAGVGTYMLLDPKSAGLAELFKDTAFGKALMLDEAFKYSEKKPDDTEIQGRFKNVLDYMTGESLIGTAILGIKGMYGGGKKLLPYIKGGEDTTKAVEDTISKIVPSADATSARNLATKSPLEKEQFDNLVSNYNDLVAKGDPQSLADANEIYYGLKAQAEQTGSDISKIVSTPPAVKVAEEVPVQNAVVLDNHPPKEYEQYTFDHWIERINKPAEPPLIDISPEDMLATDKSLTTKRPPQNIPEMIAEGKKRQETDGWFKKLLEDRKADPTAPLSAEDSLALDIEGLRAQVNAKNLASKALATSDPLDVMAANEALDYQLKVLAVKEAVASEAGRTLGITEGLARAVESGTDAESVKIGLEILGSKGRAKLLQKYLDTYGGVRPIQERLKMIEMLNEIPDEKFATAELNNLNTMKKVVKQTGFRKFTDAAYSVWTSSVLTMKTAGNVYALNQAATGMEIANHYVASLIGKIPKFGGKSSITEANAFATGFFQAQRKGHALGIEAMVEGKAPRGYTVNGDFSTIAKDVDTAAANSVWGWLYDKGMSAATMTGRLVMSADVVSKYVNEFAFLKSYAAKEAMGMAERMAIPSSERSAYIGKYIDDVMANPSEGMMKQAKDMAEKLTQSRSIDNVPVLGKINQALEEDPTGLLRFIVPFFRTGVNTTLNALEYVPVMNLALKETRDALIAGGSARDMALAKMANGSLFTLGVYEAYKSGIITGEMPNPKQRQALADAGKGVVPYSLNLESLGMGTYYIRGLDPIGKVLRMGALYSAVREGNANPEMEDYLHTLGAVAFSQVTPETMNTYNAILDAVSGKDDKAMKNLLATTLANTVVPLRGTIKQMSQAAEGLMKEDGTYSMRNSKDNTDGFIGMFQAQLKDIIGYGLPMKRDIFGQVIDQHWLTAVSPWPTIDTENSQIGKKLRVLADVEGKMRLAGFEPTWTLEMPSDDITGPVSQRYKELGQIRVKMTPEEYDQFILKMQEPTYINGPTLKEAVDKALTIQMPALIEASSKSYQGAEEQEVAYKRTINHLDKVFKSYEDNARKYIEALPDVQKRLNEEIKKKKPADMSGLSVFGGN